MNNNRNGYSKPSASYSWPIITLFLIIFFPVAIFMIYKKFSINKTNMIKNSKVIKNMSFVLFGFAFVYCLMGLTGNLETTDETMSPIGAALLMLTLFGGGGVWLLLISMKMKKTGELYQKYARAVANQNSMYIDNIASIVGMSCQAAESDLHKMLDDGFFIGAYIDAASRKLVLQGTGPFSGSDSGSYNPKTKVVKCQNCGASNTVFIGRANECQYCSSPLE